MIQVTSTGSDLALSRLFSEGPKATTLAKDPLSVAVGHQGAVFRRKGVNSFGTAISETKAPSVGSKFRI